MTSSNAKDTDIVDLSVWHSASDDNVYVSSGLDTVTLSSLDYDSGTIATSITGINVPWVTTTGTGDTFTLNPDWNNSGSAKIKLDGPEADIEINGESLVDMLKQIEQRLNILKPNVELESEWDELRALGEQYRALEKHILEKQATWDRLRAMPKPEID